MAVQKCYPMEVSSWSTGMVHHCVYLEALTGYVGVQQIFPQEAIAIQAFPVMRQQYHC
jgi:hypothetical protein